MIDAKILQSEWIEPKNKKTGFGLKLKAGAPESVRKEFEQFTAAQKAVNKSAKGINRRKDI